MPPRQNSENDLGLRGFAREKVRLTRSEKLFFSRRGKNPIRINDHNAHILVQSAESEIELVSIQVLAFGHSGHTGLKIKDTSSRDIRHRFVKLVA